MPAALGHRQSTSSSSTCARYGPCTRRAEYRVSATNHGDARTPEEANIPEEATAGEVLT